MSDTSLRSAVVRAVLTELAAAGEYWVPAAVSSRHCHLSRADLERLFGPGHELTPLRMLEQPGQFAAEEKVTLETPKGRLSLRVVGPVRKESQVELSMTEARQLGLRVPVRLSGELEGSPGCRLVSGDRSADLPRGVIAAARHLHMSPAETEAFGLRDGQEVSLLAGGPRGGILEHVTVRSGVGHLLEAHIDTDEANALGIQGGALCRLVRPGGEKAPPAAVLGLIRRPAGGLSPAGTGSVPGGGGASPAPRAEAPRRKETLLDYSARADLLLTEELVYRAAGQGMKYIRLAPGTLVTPLARDVAWEKDIELIYPDGKNERR